MKKWKYSIHQNVHMCPQHKNEGKNVWYRKPSHNPPYPYGRPCSYRCITDLYFHNTISFTYCINVNLFFQAQINSRLQRHKNDVHYKIKDFQCWKCPKRFNSQTVLNKHLVAVHKEVLDDDKQMKVTEKQIGEFSIITN